MFELAPLPYAKNALQPIIWEETLNYHYDKHHAGYVKNLNNFIKDTELEGKSLEAIIKTTNGDASKKAIFNNAAQVWNHDFFWKSLKEPENYILADKLSVLIDASFGDFDAFKVKFIENATKHFGSGWSWLVYNKNLKKLEIIDTSDAYTPLTDNNLQPLLVIDVWEHAYYLDYQNIRADYVKGIVDNLLNFNFAFENLKVVL